MKQIKEFVKNEVVLVIAAVLAVLSMFIVTPDKEYMEYIDFRTLAILFCLMAVMAGLQQMGVFREIAERLLAKVHKLWQLVVILVMLCFFFSMLITNDVALITFVPFSFIILELLGEEIQKKLLIPVIVMQTIAANLGSMFTPIGNPQNIYLHGISGMGIGEFMLLMLPYTAASFVLLLVYSLFLGVRTEKKAVTDSMQPFGTMSERTKLQGSLWDLIRYLILFVLSLLTVAGFIPYLITFGIAVLSMLIFDRKIFSKIDYALLLTFIGFFVFIGNMGRIPAFRDFLQSMIAGNEVLTSVVSSQVISNVPAALLLSGFTEDVRALVVGTNLGGLGTLIASMASLISYKYVVKEDKCSKGTYFAFFTVANVIFLAILAGVHSIL